MPICICSKEEYCIAEYGEGLYEAEYSGVGTTEEHILQEYDVTSPAIPMTDLELYWEFLPKALSIWYSSVIGQISSFAFLDCLPFKVLAGYTLENHVRECSFLCNFYSFPLKRSVTFPGDGDSYFMEIDSRRFIIPLKDYLGYSPETIEITIDISYFLCDIIIEDVKYKKRVYFESDGNYTNIILTNKLRGIICLNLAQTEKVLEERLKEKARCFARIGKRFIINLNYVYQINVIKQRLVLSDYSSFAFQLEISKEALKKLKEIFLNIKSA